MKIGFTGSHSCGKTTVVNKLKTIYPIAEIVNETARQCPLPLNEGARGETEVWILAEQLVKEYRAITMSDLVICDRTPADVVAYAWRLYGKGRAGVDIVKSLETIATRWMPTYDFVFYCPIEFPVVADGVRSDCEKFRADIDRLLRETLKDMKVDYIMCNGTPSERVAIVRNEIKL